MRVAVRAKERCKVQLEPFDRKVIVVTGGSSGIGRATALEAPKRGTKVVIAAHGAEAMAVTGREIGALGRRS